MCQTFDQLGVIHRNTVRVILRSLHVGDLARMLAHILRVPSNSSIHFETFVLTTCGAPIVSTAACQGVWLLLPRLEYRKGCGGIRGVVWT
jgi:hypothetical protein